MTKRSALIPCAAIILAAATGACSGSTSPNNSGDNNNGSTTPQSPSKAAKGDSVDLTGTYNLTMFAFDSSDGGQSTLGTDASDGGTLTITTTTYALAWTGVFQNGNQNTHGSYEAVDTSSTAERGTIALYDSVKAQTQNGTWVVSNDTLTVSIPSTGNNGTVTDVSYWIKQ
jgi:hypothetical protein